MIRLRISGCRAAETPVDFTEEHNIFETGTQRAFLNGTLLHMKIRERMGPSKGVTQQFEAHERGTYVGKLA